MARKLHEREFELARIDEGLRAAAAGCGRLLVLGGPAGVGKTRLLGVALERARAAGLRVLRARAGERETEFAFGVVRQLFEPALAGLGSGSSVYAGAAAFARPLFESAPDRAPRLSEGERAYSALHGLYWLTANLAAQTPLVLAVDDLPWCDVASRRWLHYLTVRLDETPALLLVTERSGDRGPPGQRPLSDGVGEGIASMLELAPLSRSASDAVVHEILGGTVDGGFREACYTATGGNPLLLRALLDDLERRGIAPGPGSAELVAGTGPRAVQASVLARLARLGDDAARLAGASAVLGTRVALRHAAELAGLASAGPRSRQTRSRRRRSSAAVRSSSCTRSCGRPSMKAFPARSARGLTDRRLGCWLPTATIRLRSQRIFSTLSPPGIRTWSHSYGPRRGARSTPVPPAPPPAISSAPVVSRPPIASSAQRCCRSSATRGCLRARRTRLRTCRPRSNLRRGRTSASGVRC